MITAHEARILLTQNEKILADKLEGINDCIIRACYDQQHEITYICAPEWLHSMELVLKSYGFTISIHNGNNILIKW